MAKSATARIGKKSESVGKTARVRRQPQVEEPKKELYLGLCMTCIHADGCAFRRDVSQAVLECDEFDTGQVAAQTIDRSDTLESVSGVTESTKFKGLCINCDIRLDCKMHRPEEGVWHCEEYV